MVSLRSIQAKTLRAGILGKRCNAGELGSTSKSTEGGISAMVPRARRRWSGTARRMPRRPSLQTAFLSRRGSTNRSTRSCGSDCLPTGWSGRGARRAGRQGRDRCPRVQSRIQGADNVASLSGGVHERSNSRRGNSSRNRATRRGICLRLPQLAGGGREAAVRERGRRMERIPQGSIRVVMSTGEALR